MVGKGKKKLAFGSIILLLVGVFVFSLVYWFQSEQRDYQQSEQVEFDPDSITGIKGRLLKSRVSEEETDYVDLSQYSEIVFALLQPNTRTRDERSRYPEICEIKLERKGQPPIVVRAVLFGVGGKMLFALDGPYCYIRTSRQHRQDEDGLVYADEVGCLAYLIESIWKNDLEKRQDYEQVLRRSVGLPLLPKPENGQEKGGG